MSLFPPVSTLVPHSGAMVFLDSILLYSNDRLTALCRPRAAHSPVKLNGGVSVWTGLEYVSQAIAAFGTLNAGEGNPPQPGYLVSVRSVRAAVRQFEADLPLEIEVVLEQSTESFSLFNGFVRTHSQATALSGRFGVYGNLLKE